MKSIRDYLSTLEPFYGIAWAETLDVNEDGVETTLWCIRYRKSDKEPRAKKAFIHSEKRDRVNSDLYFNHMCGWRVLFDKRTDCYGYVSVPADELYEVDMNPPNISKVELLWDIHDLHRLLPETRYFDEVPERAIVDFIKMWRLHPELEFVWKDKDLKWHWSDSRIYKLKDKKQVIRIMKERNCSLNDALGLIKYGSDEKMAKERSIHRWRSKLKKYKLSREHLAHMDKYFEEQGKIYLSDYEDYLDLCIYFRQDLKEYGVLFPKNFMEKHDNMVELKKMKEERKSILKRKRYEKRFAQIATTYGGILEHLSTDVYRLEIPTTVDQMISVGKKMHNCVGTNGYDKKMYQGNCLIIVAYKKRTPVVCIELDNKFKVRQLRGNHNQETTHCKVVEPLIYRFTKQAVSLSA